MFAFLQQTIVLMFKQIIPAFVIFSLLGANVVAQGTYFQQQNDYTINVKLDDVKHELVADETIVYTNNAPTALNEIYFQHVYP